MSSNVIPIRRAEENLSEIIKYKFVLVGDAGVGKSCLLFQYFNGKFNDKTTFTIGVDFMTKIVSLNKVKIKLELWDTGGQERFKSLPPFYYRNAQGAIVVYDITDHRTFKKAKNLIREIRQDAGPDILIALAGNKADLDRTDSINLTRNGEKLIPVKTRTAQAYANEQGILFMETSAKTAINTEALFTALIKTVYSHNESASNCSGVPTYLPNNVIDLKRESRKARKSRKCCK